MTLTAGGNDFLQGTWQVLNTAAGWSQVSGQPLANLDEIAARLAAFGCPVLLNTIYDPTDGDDSLLALFGLAGERQPRHEQPSTPSTTAFVI